MKEKTFYSQYWLCDLGLVSVPLPPSTTTRLTSLCKTTVPVRYSWLALASTLNFLAGFCRLRILCREVKVLKLDTPLSCDTVHPHTLDLIHIFELHYVVSLQIHTCTLQYEHHSWRLLLTSWPSSLSSAPMWAYGLHLPPHEPCKGHN